MNIHISHAIVIRQFFGFSHKIVLLDKELGVITCYFSRRARTSLTHGCRIEYVAQAREELFFIERYTVVNIPAGWVSSDVLFLHHVLELCLYFLIARDDACLIFTLLNVLYDDVVSEYSSLCKYIVLCRFFIIVGLLPESCDETSQHLIRLISQTSDIMFDVQSVNFIQTYAPAWLRACLDQHPRAREFKTRHFLTMVPDNECS